MKDLPQITLQEIVKSYICHVHDVLMDDPIPGETDTKFLFIDFSTVRLQNDAITNTHEIKTVISGNNFAS